MTLIGQPERFNFHPKSLELFSKQIEQCIIIDEDDLPPVSETISMLMNENVSLGSWIHIALMYYNNGNPNDFLAILKASEAISFCDNDEKIHGEIARADKLGAYFMNVAMMNIPDQRESYGKVSMWARADKFFAVGDRLSICEPNHIIYRAIFELMKTAEIKESIPHLQYLVKNFPLAALPLLALASAYLEAKHYKRALVSYRRAFKISPFLCGSQVRLGMAFCLANLGMYGKARRAFQQVIQMDPQCADAYAALGVMCQSNEADEHIAMACFKKAYAIDKTHPLALIHLSDYFFLTEQTQESLTLASAAVLYSKNDRQLSDAHFKLGRAQHKLGEFDQAFESYQSAYKYGGDDFIDALNGLAQISLYREDIATAIKYYHIMLIYDSSCIETQRMLGLLYAQSKDPKDLAIAKQFLKNAIEAFPEDVCRIVVASVSFEKV
ncbi:hypothetical protein ACOME3_009220 [Neoechinorhynchus agilis]